MHTARRRGVLHEDYTAHERDMLREELRDARAHGELSLKEYLAELRGLRFGSQQGPEDSEGPTVQCEAGMCVQPGSIRACDDSKEHIEQDGFLSELRSPRSLARPPITASNVPRGQIRVTSDGEERLLPPEDAEPVKNPTWMPRHTSSWTSSPPPPGLPKTSFQLRREASDASIARQRFVLPRTPPGTRLQSRVGPYFMEN
jgi:hypothetical protein